MTIAARQVQRTYLTLVLLSTLAASFIWGVNTLFLLDAGLSNIEAFAANAFFTAGMMVFEIPTGVIADTRGRRTSYLLGTLTLIISTLLYLLMWQLSAPFWAWGVVSVFLGLGFSFFSGAVEAWLVDALNASGYKGKLETIFARGEIVDGVAMLSGSVAGGLVAQFTNLGVPYIVRVLLLVATLLLAWFLMKDIGFTPVKSKRPLHEVKIILQNSIKFGLGNRPVRWLMLAGPFTAGISVYVFYAMQPYLLELYGDPHAYSIAGLVAAIVAGAQIAGGLLVPHLSKIFRRRSVILLLGTILSTAVIFGTGLLPSFWVVLGLLILWGLLFASLLPVRQAYINGLIESKQRATVLSFDSLLSSGGGVVFQPILGRVADVWHYPASYFWSGVIQIAAIPFIYLALRERASSDSIIPPGKQIPDSPREL